MQASGSDGASIIMERFHVAGPSDTPIIFTAVRVLCVCVWARMAGVRVSRCVWVGAHETVRDACVSQP